MSVSKLITVRMARNRKAIGIEEHLFFQCCRSIGHFGLHVMHKLHFNKLHFSEVA